MVVYLESFLEKQPNVKYLFTDSITKTAPSTMKAAWSDRLKKNLWADPDFKGITRARRLWWCWNAQQSKVCCQLCC